MSVLEALEYFDGDVPLKGLWAKPEGQPRAAVTIYPTFINTTPSVEAKAVQLVEAGYAVLIADFYGPDAPSTPEEGFAAMRALCSDAHRFRERLRAALATTKELSGDATQLAIGFCLGGLSVLEMARDGQDLAAVVSFHGLLQSDLPADKPITPRILVCHGDADSFVPREHVTAFWQEMDAVEADWHFHSYARIEHGFTNLTTADGSPNPAYDKSADQQSWRAMHGLFDEVLSAA